MYRELFVGTTELIRVREECYKVLTAKKMKKKKHKKNILKTRKNQVDFRESVQNNIFVFFLNLID